MAALFKIEAEISGYEPGWRHAVRQERSLRAIRDSLSRWPALCRFAHDGRLEMTNSAAERAIRPLALARKNYLFAGSDASGRRAAILYTIIQTAIPNGLDPEAYLRDDLASITDHPINRIDELLPWHWAGSYHTAAA